jgi:hypothetical protein
MNQYLKSPITQRDCVVYDGVSEYLCFDSGYHRVVGWESDLIDNAELRKYPEYVTENVFTDEDNNIWLLLTMYSGKNTLIPIKGGWLVNSWIGDTGKKVLSNELVFTDFLSAYNEFYRRENQD